MMGSGVLDEAVAPAKTGEPAGGCSDRFFKMPEGTVRSAVLRM